ncbi:MAG: 50S ribosomal protein L3 [Gammaproteobacteria bacterium]|nr:50S ribosomal protein L3 [Gammaproteobacteria bacterium]
MTIGIIGRKRGMTQVFTEEGRSVSVTVIEATPNRITRLIDSDKDGYRAVQVAWGSKKPARVNKALAGIFTKAGIAAGEGLEEYRLQEGEGKELTPGSEIKVDIFKTGQKVDVSGITIGKGFAGTIKRHHFRMGNVSHGNSLSHRTPGSIGQNQSPGRVFKGKKMAGHLGNDYRTAQNLEIVSVDNARNLLLIKGAVPGAKGGKVLIKPAVKEHE